MLNICAKFLQIYGQMFLCIQPCKYIVKCYGQTAILYGQTVQQIYVINYGQIWFQNHDYEV